MASYPLFLPSIFRRDVITFGGLDLPAMLPTRPTVPTELTIATMGKERARANPRRAVLLLQAKKVTTVWVRIRK